jgi:hypothetical protein
MQVEIWPLTDEFIYLGGRLLLAAVPLNKIYSNCLCASYSPLVPNDIYIYIYIYIQVKSILGTELINRCPDTCSDP